LIRTAERLREAVRAARGQGKSIGLVPTMGALHAGHLSLVDASHRQCDFTVVTIFVNLPQFAPGEDFSTYPRTLEADLDALRGRGADVVFVPDEQEIYRPGHATFVQMHGVAEPLEGRCRPGHFRGVATIVLKLLNLATPDVAFFGQKDYQQSLVVRRLVADLDLPIEIHLCPTVREPDGLALSSRNAQLDAQQRQQALVLSRSLRRAVELAESGQHSTKAIRAEMLALLAEVPEVRLDYLAMVDAETLDEAAQVDGPTLVAITAFVGPVRLIDNCLINNIM
jgi:pantoate--beta-alanine ligase